MSSKTKIIVLRMKEIIYTAIFVGLGILLILQLGSVLSVGYEKVYLLQNSMNLNASEVINTYVYKQGLGNGSRSDYAYSTAVDLFNSVVSLIMIVSVNHISRRVNETSLW